MVSVRDAWRCCAALERRFHVGLSQRQLYRTSQPSSAVTAGVLLLKLGIGSWAHPSGINRAELCEDRHYRAGAAGGR